MKGDGSVLRTFLRPPPYVSDPCESTVSAILGNERHWKNKLFGASHLRFVDERQTRTDFHGVLVFRIVTQQNACKHHYYFHLVK